MLGRWSEGRECATDNLVSRSQPCCQISFCTGQPPTTKNYVPQNVISVTVEKSWFNPNSLLKCIKFRTYQFLFEFPWIPAVASTVILSSQVSLVLELLVLYLMSSSFLLTFSFFEGPLSIAFWMGYNFFKTSYVWKCCFYPLAL